MALNLVRNSRVFFTTNVSSTGVINSSGFLPGNTAEIQVLDGFSFSQSTSNETVTVSEAGSTPVRGQRAFNTALEPASFSFSSYLCSKIANSRLFAEESHLWNALFTNQPLISNTATYPTTTGTGIAFQVSYAPSTLTLGITGTSPTMVYPGLVVGEVVQISGVVAGSGTAPTAAELAGLNGLATIATISTTSITLTYIGSPSTGTFANSTGIAINGTIGIALYQQSATPITGTSVVYTYKTTVGSTPVSRVQVTGTGLNTADYPVGTTVTFRGFTTAAGIYNQPAVVTASTSTQIDFDYYTKIVGGVADAVLTASNLLAHKTGWITDATSAVTTTAASNSNQLVKFGLLFVVDQVAYAIDNCVLNELTMDFGLDGIVTGAWSGQGTAVREFSSTGITLTAITANAVPLTQIGSIGFATPKATDTQKFTSKLNTCKISYVGTLKDSAGINITNAIGGVNYITVPLTGGSITISNNVTYITPAILGTVNAPVTYFTGTRAISGTLNAYLKTGTSTNNDQTGDLLSNMLKAASTAVEPVFKVEIALGGAGSWLTTPATKRIELTMPSATLGIPGVDVQQVVSTNINFTGQGYNTSQTTAAYDIEKNNDLLVTYYSA
jgi:hypothetical protein